MSPSEIKTYIKLLKLKETRIGPLIKETNIASSKIYDVIERLIKKGLVSYKLVQSTKIFKASHPKYLKFLIEERKKELDEDNKELEKYLESLDVDSNVEGDGRVEFFEGMKAVRQAHNILFSMADEFSVLKYFFPYEKLTEEQNLFYKKLWLDHKDLNLQSRGISTSEV